jgi:predicted transcriptional regulator
MNSNKKEGKITVTIRLPRPVKKQLDQAALHTRRSKSIYVEIALENQFRIDFKEAAKRSAGILERSN